MICIGIVNKRYLHSFIMEVNFLPENSNLQGEIVMIMGANSGIGKATAIGLAYIGATIIMVCRGSSQ